MKDCIYSDQGAVIALRSGSYFDFENPDSSEYTIEDIAHGLSNLCRFSGQVEPFYSVAEHSVLASWLLPPPLALQGLMHDAPEFVIGDMVTPLSRLLPDYRALKARIERSVWARYGLPATLSPEVKAVDAQLLATEKVQAMGNRDRWKCLEGVEPARVRLNFWTPAEAKGRFLQRFFALGDDLPLE